MHAVRIGVAAGDGIPFYNRALQVGRGGFDPRFNRKTIREADVKFRTGGHGYTGETSAEVKGLPDLARGERERPLWRPVVAAHEVIRVRLARPPANQTGWRRNALGWR